MGKFCLRRTDRSSKGDLVNLATHCRVFDVSAAWTRFTALLITLLVAAIPAFAGQVTLAWDSVSNPLLAGYKVHYGLALGDYTATADAGTGTTYQVQNLTEGATYHFVVTAYDQTGAESGYSNDVSAFIPVVAPSGPVASFIASVTTGTAPLALNF